MSAGTLIRNIAAFSAIGYGINVMEQNPPGQVMGVGANVVGIVAALPWGPVNEVTTITSSGEFFDTFCPPVFAAENTYTPLRALLNKRFPAGLKVVRIDATSAVAATSGAITAGTGTITITANYKGTIGNLISYQWTAATDLDAAKRNLVITIGTRYTATYENVTFGAITTQVVDDYVTVTSAAPSALPSAGSATALASGAEGSAIAGDYVGSSSSAVGIRKFYADGVDVNVLFVAECPEALKAAVNTGLEAYVADTDKGMVVLCTPNSATVAATITDAASYRDDRIVYVYPRVKTTNFYDSAAGTVTVDGNAFAAAAIANVDPERSPGGASGAPFLQGITGLENEDITRANYDALNAAGVAPFQMTTSLGAIIRKGITTSLTSGLTQIFRRRMTDYITSSLATRWENFAELPLDVDLDTQTLGPNMGPLVAETLAFLAGLGSRIHSYSVDAFSANSQSNLDAGRWYVLVRVKLFPAADEIVLISTIGEGVTVAEAA